MTSTIELDLQTATKDVYFPREEQFKTWAEAAFDKALEKSDQPLPYNLEEAIDLTIRIVDAEEIQTLNKEYRDKDKATNILSFPFEAPEHVEINLLGDLIICSPVIARESKEQEKPILNHWAHMVVHGVLHLLGYDHQEDDEAEQMESLEIEILASFDIANPYAIPYE